MKRVETPASVIEVPRSANATSAVLISLADTTWRMFVPTIGLLLIGRYADSQFDTKPFGMIIGIVVGAVFAWLLVRKQLHELAEEDKRR